MGLRSYMGLVKPCEGPGVWQVHLPCQVHLFTPFPILKEHQELPQWHSNDQSVCTDTLPPVNIGAIGAIGATIGAIGPDLDSAGACHRRKSAIGAIGVLSEITIELSDPPSG